MIVANAHKFGSKSRVRIDQIPNKDVDLVIVDEAHHYPADTWQTIINNFKKAKKIFLTATPTNGGKDILQDQNSHLCYSLRPADLVADGIIRDVVLNDDTDSNNENDAFNKISSTMKVILDAHDSQDPDNFHQAMVLCQTISDLNSVDNFVYSYNQNIDDEIQKCQKFVSNTSYQVLRDFRDKKFRTLIICGSLLEGFDHPNVSVVGIARNVRSPIIFAQFVGRSFRKLSRDDPVTATIVTDKYFNQRIMMDNFEKLPENDIDDEDEDL